MLNLKTSLLVGLLLGSSLSFGQTAPVDTSAVTYATGAEDRAYTVATLERIVRPVLQSMAEQRSKTDFPVREWENDRVQFTHLEAFARTLVDVAPWLELGPDDSPEGRLRAEMIDLAVRATRHAFDPAFPDRAAFTPKNQPLFEAAFISVALLRAPKQLWGQLTESEQARVIAGLKETRPIRPGQNNWLLFSAEREAFIWQVTGECERAPIDYALQKHQEWYAGDGTYGDGPEYHWDYYNSFVIHPLLLEVLKVCQAKQDTLADFYPTQLKRAQRYAAVLERLISPEGTYPVFGRSSSYRLGSLQLLSQLILSGEAPPNLMNPSTRSALTAVTRRMFDAPGNFDAQGWLQMGVVGTQYKVRDSYNNSGSLYLTTAGFLHLGLPATHPFWTGPGGPWTQRRIWSGDPGVIGDRKM